MRLAEIEQRILATLDEAGAENAVSLLNTVVESKGSSQDLESYLMAVKRLLENELIGIVAENGKDAADIDLTGDQAVAAIDEFATRMSFDPSAGIWTDVTRSGPPFRPLLPLVVATEAGKQAGRRIVSERSEDWWRRQR